MDQTYMKEQPVLKLIVSMALPMVISMMVSSLYNIVDSFFIARISEDAMTALSLVYPVQNLINAVMIGFGIGINAVISFYLGAQDKKMADRAATQGMRPLLGYNYGAGEHKRVHKIFQDGLILVLVMMAAGMAICLAVPGQLMGLFTANPITMKAGSVALRVISLGFLASSVSVICSGALEGLGKGVHSLIISLCRYVVVIIPVAFIVSRFMGAVGVWHAFWITEVVTAVIAYVVYRKGVKG